MNILEKKIQNYKKFILLKIFKKLFFKFNVDIIKIDVEGYEIKIINSILKDTNPLLIEVETNLNNEIYPNSFNEINTKLRKKNYKLVTAYPVFKATKKNNFKNSSFEIGNYDNPIIRLPLEQFECIYIKEKKIYDIKDVSILLGYGLLYEVKDLLRQSRIKTRKNITLKLKKIINNFFLVFILIF